MSIHPSSIGHSKHYISPLYKIYEVNKTVYTLTILFNIKNNSLSITCHFLYLKNYNLHCILLGKLYHCRSAQLVVFDTLVSTKGKKHFVS